MFGQTRPRNNKRQKVSSEMASDHGNLRTMQNTGPANICVKEHLVKNRLISFLDKEIYFQRDNFSGVYKASLHFTK
jgi:hypothetical protein